MSDGREEQATPARRKKAREQGDVVRSRELTSGVAALAGLGVFAAVSPLLLTGWRTCFVLSLHAADLLDGSVLHTRSPQAAALTLLAPVGWPLLCVLLASFVAALVIGCAQMGGVQLRVQNLSPKLSRLSPAEHMQQIFSARSVGRLVKSLLPAGAVVWFGWSLLERVVRDMPIMGLTRLPTALEGGLQLALKSAGVMVAWAAVDYGMEYRAWAARLRMSKQEIREEVRDQMGNPQVKGRIRQIQRAMRRRRVRADLRRAAVVITNPTHYAVALEFDFTAMQAPLVLAKGRDLHALEMRTDARDAGVPLIENPPLARSLYRSVDEGQAIPYELYAAVAGILAYLMRERQETEHRERQRMQNSAPEVSTVVIPEFRGGL